MINKDRIVPVTSTDLLTIYFNTMKLAGTSVTAVSAADNEGDFALTSGSGNLFADEPVQYCDFGEAVTSAVLYFVAAHSYKGFSVAGTVVETAGADVDPDAATLYTATLATGTVTIAKVGA
jgi:hypothetical protein